MKTRALLLGPLLAILVTACGTTPPSKYYMLSADAEGTPGTSGISVGVGPITVPDYMKGRAMVLARDDHLLTISEYDRWAEPLEAGISRVLVLNLAVLLGTQQVSTFPWRSDAVPEYGVRVAIVQLAAGQGSAHLAASWSVQDSRSGTLLHKALSELDAPVTDNRAASIAGVYSELLLELSREISEVISREAGKS